MQAPERHPPQAGTAPRAAHKRLTAAWRQLARALEAATGQRLDGEVATRCSTLWRKHLLAGEGVDLPAALGGGLTHAAATPVLLHGVGVHLVCPHHLTVACGEASLGYLPAGRIAGLGVLAQALTLSCARLVLQEDAAADAAQAVVTALGARAAVTRIVARHPCCNVLVARAHHAQAETWGCAGAAAQVAELRALMAHQAPAPSAWAPSLQAAWAPGGANIQ